LKSKAFKPATHWLSDHPAYKLKATVDGDRGTLHFECHFIDVKTGKVAQVTAGNLDVARIDGRWMITNFVGSTSELTI
jgi:phage gp45-like